MRKTKKEKIKRNVLIVTGIILLDAGIYYSTYKNGGIDSIFSQLMYIPVILSGIFFGIKTGMISAMFSGLLIGPLMPITLTLSTPVGLYFWLLRLATLIIVGVIVGYLSDVFEENKRITKTYEYIARKNMAKKRS
ncbi:MAG: hypothetical protein WC152_03140 [Candidatus Izemoplasmatales bacterium]